MDFLSGMNWFSVSLGVICFIGVPVLLFIGWVISGTLDNKQQEKRGAEDDTLRKRGVTASAVVVSARKGMERSPFGRKEMRIDYEIEVQPEGGAPFSQSFQYWTERRGYTAIAGQLVGEAGRKIWVTYDPHDPSQMIFEYYDEERKKIVEQQDLEKRRFEFNKLVEMNNEIRKAGEEAEALITHVEDLNLPYPLKASRGVRLNFDVLPKSGSAFRSETYALIADASLAKYSTGKKVYVKFDPRQPEKAVLDSEKNKLLS